MSTKNKAQVQQEARAIDDNVDEKENTSPARRLAVDDGVDTSNKAIAGKNKRLATTKVIKVQRRLAAIKIEIKSSGC